jgi:capsular exopolysaccharide synthesis family protein
MAKDSRKGNGGWYFDIESPIAIELRRIMIRLGRSLDLDRKRCLMVTSAERGEGKSLFSLHFALVLAHHLEHRILLIDGDIRRPVQHRVFQVPRAPGLAQDLDIEKGAPAARPHPTRIPNLFFLPSGDCQDRPSRLFHGGRFRKTMARYKEDFDIIILDAPPVVPVSDPLHYVESMDGIIYMVMAGRTPQALAKRGVEILRSVGANILGVVANNLSDVLPYYYSQKYYGYEEQGDRKGRAKD